MTNNPFNYIKFKGTDLDANKEFYSTVFGWKFTDYGDAYIAFEVSGIAGGFEQTSEPIMNSSLVVLYHKELEKC